MNLCFVGVCLLNFFLLNESQMEAVPCFAVLKAERNLHGEINFLTA